MTGDLKVDTAALEAVARQLNGLSDQLTSGGITHEWQPPVAQPTGPATVAVTAAANHVAGECAANLRVFGEDIARAARFYAAIDTAEANQIDKMLPPK
ncbi:type VII secretion target [Mycobacterium sp. AZCC_0083]|uniref:type VII secretion target n=1 Tax=Mycobacterium sp. AZCC_0083 TaxID=2735882 RepID=UPI001612E554|nr:type VII secretion target [Mycobacterium sp. AZCC_0083]MBB5162576.1 hypothetical protein [Mycobacterium sp. AZCC_0083]